MSRVVSNRGSRGFNQRQRDDNQEEKPASVERLVLRLKKKPSKGVKFREDTVDNEHMGKKKSKSCCIYHPPSEDEDEDDVNVSNNDHTCSHSH